MSWELWLAGAMFFWGWPAMWFLDRRSKRRDEIRRIEADAYFAAQLRFLGLERRPDGYVVRTDAPVADPTDP